MFSFEKSEKEIACRIKQHENYCEADIGIRLGISGQTDEKTGDHYGDGHERIRDHITENPACPAVFSGHGSEDDGGDTVDNYPDTGSDADDRAAENDIARVAEPAHSLRENGSRSEQEDHRVEDEENRHQGTALSGGFHPECQQQGYKAECIAKIMSGIGQESEGSGPEAETGFRCHIYQIEDNEKRKYATAFVHSNTNIVELFFFSKRMNFTKFVCLTAMLMKYRLSLLIPVILLGVSCNRHAPAPRATIPFVEEIMKDSENPYNRMLSGIKADRNGELCIIGRSTNALLLSEIIAASDNRDNIDGFENQDGLADFAGETIACILDTMDLPYYGFIEGNREELLRESTVRHILAAVDTTTHISPFDEKGIGRKNRSKFIILADPFLAEYGGFDADTLLSSFGCGIPVVNSLDIMYDEVMSSNPGSFMAGILCGKEYTSYGIHSRRFKSKAKEHGVKDADCVVFPIQGDDSSELIKVFLDKYIDAGFTKPLNAIIIDDYGIAENGIKISLANLISVLNEESMTYRKLIADDFRIVSSSNSLINYCYDYLRKNNSFTHNIAQPALTVYYSHGGYGEKEGETVLISESYVQN